MRRTDHLPTQNLVTHLVPAFIISKLESMMIDDDLAGRDKFLNRVFRISSQTARQIELKKDSRAVIAFVPGRQFCPLK